MNKNYLILKWRNWSYKNTTLLVISLALFFYFVGTDFVQNIIRQIGDLGYIGAFITGVFFVSIFTVIPATVILFDLAKILNPIMVALLAGAGAVLGDYLIFRYLRDKVFEELSPIIDKLGGSSIKKIFLTPYFTWLLPIVGALIIASPVPDEAGVSILGLSKIKNWQFVLITFLLNSIGILIIILAART